MKYLPIDTSDVRFLVTSDPEQVLDFETKRPRADRDGQPIHSVDVLVSGEGRKGEVITVKVSGASPSVSEGNRVKVVDLVAMPWSQNGRSGVSFTASRIESIPASSKAAA